MLIVLCVILFIILVLGIIRSMIDCCEHPVTVICLATGIMGVFLVGSLIFTSTMHIIDGRNIDERIEVYQQENSQIEEFVANAINGYLSNRGIDSDKITPDKAIEAIVLYPEIAQLKFIEEALDEYHYNLNKIKSLHEEKISLKSVKWWLCFG